MRKVCERDRTSASVAGVTISPTRNMFFITFIDEIVSGISVMSNEAREIGTNPTGPGNDRNESYYNTNKDLNKFILGEFAKFVNTHR